MGSDALLAIRELLQVERNRPLGAVDLASDRIVVGASSALQEAAENLLAKAIRAVDAGDDARAGRLAARVATLPFDEFEQEPTGWSAVRRLTFNAILDAMQAAQPGDDSWLVVALDVMAGAGETGRLAVVHALAVVAQDWGPEPAELRRARAAIGAADPADWDQTPPPSDDAEHARAILDGVRTLAAYRRGCAGR